MGASAEKAETHISPWSISPIPSPIAQAAIRRVLFLALKPRGNKAATSAEARPANVSQGYSEEEDA